MQGAVSLCVRAADPAIAVLMLLAVLVGAALLFVAIVIWLRGQGIR